MITKKAIREELRGINRVCRNMNWSLADFGAYKKNGEVALYTHYNSQGLDANVHNHSYDDIIHFTELINNTPELNQEEKVQMIYESIQDFTEECKKDSAKVAKP